MIVVLFWISALLIAYTYLGYPIWLYIQKKISVKSVCKDNYEPTVTIVIAARNEEHNIRDRIENLLQQNYPADKLQIIVVSDGSTDHTVKTVQGIPDNRVQVIPLSVNQGKAVALNTGVAAAQGDIILFTDARQQFQPQVIKELVANFADATIGCVSGELLFLKDVSSSIQAEIGAYWKYEKWIRKAESATGSVVGATGAIYAIRRSLYQPLPQGTILDDVLTPMRVVMQGYRTVFDGSAVAFDVVSKDVAQEWKRKVRTLAGNWQLISLQPSLLLPFSNPCWLRFVSHKLLRLIVPGGLVVLLFSSLLLSGMVYRTALSLQLLCYGAAAAGYSLPAARNFRLINLSYFFLVMNVAAMAGFWRWVTGQTASAWQPAYTNKKV
jgi:cellulose synthase/poly-beta-1,6-N-acetylglucosamine synthase-like glycosyltransferase